MISRYLSVKDNSRYQHYTTRHPPWVKLYRSMPADYELRQVPIASRLCLIYLIILASETDNRIPHDYRYLSERMGFDVNESVLTPLIMGKFVLAQGARRSLAHSAARSPSLSSLPNSRPKDGESEGKMVAWIVEHWSKIPGVQPVTKLGPNLRKRILLLLKEHQTETWWDELFDRVGRSDFLSNRLGKNWSARLDWVLGPKNLEKVESGNYDNLATNNRPPAPPPKTDPIGRGQWKNQYGDPKQYGYE